MAKRMRNGVWVHQTELEAYRGLLTTCRDAVDARTPSTADWQAVREAVYRCVNVWMDIDDEDRVIRDLIAIEADLEAEGSPTTGIEGSESPRAEEPPAEP